SIPDQRGRDHASPRRDHRSLHAGHHARAGIRGAGQPHRLSRIVRRHWFPKPYADVVARLRVPAAFLLLAAFAWFSRPTAASLMGGIPISAIGLALRGWAAGHLAKNQRLAQSGPYAATRNPLYLGTLVTALGLAVAGHSA